MIDNSMMTDAPFVTGSWYNHKTGDSFTVRDTFIEDNNRIVILTTDGRHISADMLEDYVKTDKPMPKRNVSEAAKTNDEIPPEVRALMADTQGHAEPVGPRGVEGNTNLLNGMGQDLMGLDNIYEPRGSQSMLERPVTQRVEAPAPAQTFDEDMLFINRLLGRVSGPTVTTLITWDKYPEEQMHMLELMSVDPGKIAEYFASKVDVVEIFEQVKKAINDRILGVEQPKPLEMICEEAPYELEVDEELVEGRPDTCVEVPIQPKPSKSVAKKTTTTKKPTAKKTKK